MYRARYTRPNYTGVVTGVETAVKAGSDGRPEGGYEDEENEVEEERREEGEEGSGAGGEREEDGVDKRQPLQLEVCMYCTCVHILLTVLYSSQDSQPPTKLVVDPLPLPTANITNMMVCASAGTLRCPCMQL